MSKKHDVAGLKLAAEGRKKIEWAGQRMPVLNSILSNFKKNKPLRGYTLGACLHVTAETANLMIALKAGGAKVSLCASNPLSTQDSVAASLVSHFDIPVFAVYGENKKTYYQHIKAVLNAHPQVTMDDGADLVSELHKSKQVKEIIGSSEETTTGVVRLRAMAESGALKIPVIAVNDSLTKHFFDNRHGTGQSAVDGVLRATNILLAGKQAVVCGYGMCGRGIAARLRGMGAIVTVTEVDPVKALEALMDGYNVDSISHTTRYGDLFVTATGNKGVISVANLKRMKSGAIVANAGHFNVEFDYDALVRVSKSKRQLREHLEEFTLPGGKKIFVLAQGRLVNLVAAEGHPAEVMDMSFANQALAAIHFINNRGKLWPKVYTLPKEIDVKVAALKLRSMGVKTDSLTTLQKKYLSSWQEGT